MDDWMGASVWRVGLIGKDRLMNKIHQGSNFRKRISGRERVLRGSAKKKNSKNPSLLGKWVGGSKSHSDFFWENRHKIALNQW